MLSDDLRHNQDRRDLHSSRYEYDIMKVLLGRGFQALATLFGGSDAILDIVFLISIKMRQG